MDRNGTTHPRCPDCGTIWRQSGNRTGHCSQCCRTFQGISAFDRHQAHPDGGRVHCLDPSAVRNEDGSSTFASTVGITPLDLGTVYWSLTMTDEKRAAIEALKNRQSHQ